MTVKKVKAKKWEVWILSKTLSVNFNYFPFTMIKFQCFLKIFYDLIDSFKGDKNINEH